MRYLYGWCSYSLHYVFDVTGVHLHTILHSNLKLRVGVQTGGCPRYYIGGLNVVASNYKTISQMVVLARGRSLRRKLVLIVYSLSLQIPEHR